MEMLNGEYNQLPVVKTGGILGEKIMKIGIIGVGYVGNAVKKGFESKGHKVLGYDKFKESDSFDDVIQCDIIFVCVPTPSKKDGSIDTSIMNDVMERISDNKPFGVIAIKSSVLPGTAQNYKKLFPHLKIVSNPELLKESTSEYDFLHPNVILIGYVDNDKNHAKKLESLYKNFDCDNIKIVSSEEAEMAKYMSNCYFAVRVIFANEIYDLCQKLNIDYDRTRDCFESIRFVAPGHFDVTHGGYRGFGGHCLPKDLQAILSKAKEKNIDCKLLKKTWEINKKLTKH